MHVEDDHRLRNIYVLEIVPPLPNEDFKEIITDIAKQASRDGTFGIHDIDQTGLSTNAVIRYWHDEGNKSMRKLRKMQQSIREILSPNNLVPVIFAADEAFNKEES